MKNVYFFKENNCHNQLTFDFYIKFSIFQAPKVKNDNNFNRIGFYLTVSDKIKEKVEEKSDPKDIKSGQE